MLTIKVLGSGCAKCVKTAELIEKAARDANVSASIVKETDPAAILHYGVMRTPAVVIDDRLVFSGAVPNAKQINAWLLAED